MSGPVVIRSHVWAVPGGGFVWVASAGSWAGRGSAASPAAAMAEIEAQLAAHLGEEPEQVVRGVRIHHDAPGES